MGDGHIVNDPKLKGIVSHHNKTASQVALRFQVQRNVIVIPKSVHKERLIEDSQIFDFKLTDDEIKQIKYKNAYVKAYCERVYSYHTNIIPLIFHSNNVC